MKIVIDKLQKHLRTDIHYVIKGASWLIIGRLALAAISLWVMIVLGNRLPKESFGMYQYVLSVVNIFALATLPGVNSALTRSVAKGFEGTLRQAFRFRVRFGLLGMTGIIGFCLWHAIQGDITIAIGIIVAAVFTLIKEPSIGAFFYLDGKKQFDKQSIYRVVAITVASLLFIGSLYFTEDILVIILVFFGTQGLTHYVVHHMVQRTVTNTKTDASMILLGKNLTWMLVASSVAGQIDKLILWKFLGPVQVAIYSFAILPITKIFQFIPISSLALPKLSESNFTLKQKKSIFRKFVQLFVLTVPLTLVLILAAPFAFQILFPKYLESVRLFQLLSLMMLTLPFTLLDTTFVSEAKQRELFMTRVIAPSIQIIFLIILVPIFGVYGAVWATVLGRFIRSTFEFIYFLKLKPESFKS